MSSDVMTNTSTKTKTKSKLGVRMIAQVGMLGALSAILMLIEIPLPFAPNFYQIDFSEIPVLIGAFALGPVAGALVELVKIFIHFLAVGTTTAGVGEAANFLIGCGLCLPAAIIYRRFHNRTGAVIGMATGTFLMTFLGCFLNAFVLLPAYAAAFHMPIDGLVAMGTAINENINSLLTFVILSVAPFNLLKGFLVSLIVFLIYKKVRPIFKISAN